MAFNNNKFDNSSAAEEREDNLSSEEKNVRIFAKQMLQSRLFLGHFRERRLVEPLQAYRDVVVINESETQLRKDLSIVRKRLKNFYKHNYWIGITEPTSIGAPQGHSIWVESNVERFGHYWFKIKSISFRRKEILLKIKLIRPMTDFEKETKNVNESDLNMSFEVLLQNYKNSLKENTMWYLSKVLTIQNFKQTLTFFSVLIATILTYTFYGMGFIMEFSLRFMRETSVFIQALTPFMIAVVNIFGKIVGGFYILIAMLFGKQTSVPVAKQPMIYYQNRPRAIQMPGYDEPSTFRPRPRYRQGPIITEME